MALGAALLLWVGVQPAEAAGPAIEGIVVDESRRPVADVRVTARIGAVTLEAMTDAEGRFHMEVEAPFDVPRNCGLLAHHDDGDAPRAADAVIHLPTDTRLWPSATLRLRVVETLTITCTIDDAPASETRVMIGRASYGSFDPLESHTTDASGRLTLRLGPGAWGLIADDPRYAGTVHGIYTTEAAASFRGEATSTIALQRARRVRVRVIDEATGVPIEGAHVHARSGRHSWQALIPGQAPVRTDADGAAVLEQLPATTAVPIAAWTTEPVRNRTATVAPGLDEVEIALQRLKTHTLRWPVPDGSRTPPVGARMVFRDNAHCRNPSKTCRLDMTADAIVLRDYPDDSASGYAVFEERVAARLHYNLQSRDWTNPETLTSAFLPARPLQIALRDSTGAPVAGSRLALRGEMLLRNDEGLLARGGEPVLMTNAEGRITAEGVFFEPVAISFRGQPHSSNSVKLGVVDPMRDSAGEIVLTLPAIRDVEMHVTIDGARRLHSDLTVSSLNMVGAPRYDPERAIIHFQIVHDGAEGEFYCSPSLHGFHADGLTGGPIPESGPIVLHADMRSSLTIALSVEPESAVGYEGGVIQLQRRKGEAWIYAGDGTFNEGSVRASVDLEMKGHENWRVFERLSEGTYRVVHTRSGRVHGPFTITRNKAVWPVTMSLENIDTIELKVEGLDDLMPQIGWILQPGAPSVLPWLEEGAGIPFRGGLDTHGKGTLQLPDAMGGRYVLDHPLCELTPFEIPMGTEGPITVQAQPKHVLHIPLSIRAMALIRSARRRDAEPGLELSGWEPPYASRLHDQQKQRTATPVRVLRRVRAEDQVTWAACVAIWRMHGNTLLVPLETDGPHQLFLDLPGLVPVTLRPVRVPPEGRMFTTPITMPEGGSVRVPTPTDARDPVEFATLEAVPRRVDAGPSFTRGDQVNSYRVRGSMPEHLTAAGLPAGRYALTLSWETASGRKQTRSIELTHDGRSRVELDADLERVPADASARGK